MSDQDRIVMGDLASSIEGITGSSVFMQLFTPAMVNDPFSDALPLFQLGAAIMLDKPLIVLVDANDQIPERLRRAADRIIAVDRLRDGGMAEAAIRIQEAMQELGNG